jgi:hypothetical protein
MEIAVEGLMSLRSPIVAPLLGPTPALLPMQ